MIDETTLELPLPEVMSRALSLAQSGDFAAAKCLYLQVVASDPGNSDALTNLGVISFNLGEFDAGVGYFEKAYAIAPQDPEVHKNLVNAYSVVKDRAIQADDKPAAIAAMRNYLPLGAYRVPAFSDLSTYLAYADMPAVLSDFDGVLTPERLGKTILVACMPKSGSSWLVAALTKLTGFDRAQLSLAHVENEQELYPPLVQYWAESDTVVHQHCRASAPTIQLVQAFGMHPVVLVRNLPDTLVSMRDFWAIGAVRNSFFYPDWDKLDAETRHDALIGHLGPWYIQFYASWKIAEAKGVLAPFWVRYDEMIPDKTATLKAVTEFCGLTPSDEEIAAAIAATDGDRVKTRFNKGVAGRGAETFTAAQLDTLRGLTRPFPSIDFSPIGL